VTNKLAQTQQELAKRLDPKIETTANPRPDWLLQARADVRSDKDLQAVFIQAKAEDKSPNWLADQVSTRLMARWEGESPDQAAEAALFLADEYFQVAEGIHIVSAETGRIIATVSEDDIYQPAMVPREGGGMATPLPRLDPNLEAFITTWTFEEGREKRILATLVERGHRAIAFDDPRLHPATRGGRSQIVRDVAEMTPEALLQGLGGTSAAFLGHFDLRTTPPEKAESERCEACRDWHATYLRPAAIESGATVGLCYAKQPERHPADDPACMHFRGFAPEPDLEGCAGAKDVLRIGDQTTINIHHDRRAMLRGVLPQGWVREMARLLAVAAHKRGCDRSLDVSEVPTMKSETPSALWVIPPGRSGPSFRSRTPRSSG
jgi:hypothetical protein